MKKRYVCCFIGALLLLAALIWASGWAAARFAPPALGLPEHAELAEHGAVQPGDVLTATALAVVPADTIPERPEVSGDGIVPLSGETELVNWRWNTCAYRVTARFRTLKNGETTDARLQFRLRPFPADRAAREIVLPLPGFSAKLDAKLAPSAELLLADEILASERASRSPWRYLWLLIPLAVVIAVAVWFLRRGAKIIAATVWDRALAAVEALRRELARGTLTPERGYARLCDVVREYLEVQLGLPASHRTTQEFMRELRRDAAVILPEHQREFLFRFLTAADLVKFAKGRSDRAAFEAAAERAAELIRATAPHEEGR